MSQTPSIQQLQDIMDHADCLKTQSEVESALFTMAAQITSDLAETMPVVMVVMNGGLVMAGQLLPRLNFPLEQGYLHATRYRGELEGGKELQWQALPSIPLTDRTVLILDDIYDEGHTLNEVVRACEAQGAERVVTAVLVNKLHDRKCGDLRIDYCGLEVEDRYVFGCGMDYRGYWRNAAGIFAVKDS